MPPSPSSFFVGLMSGTSLDGIDCVLASFSGNESGHSPTVAVIESTYQSFPEALRLEMLALQTPGANEIHREALAANALARLYADCVTDVLAKAGCSSREICAIGVHGQTVRHQPGLGYTKQINNPALLAELTGIDVIADFRSRDIAAAGQGAPLVPAFHHAIFGCPNETRLVVNIGGISNISVLRVDAEITGFDTGPGNVLMDMWIARHHKVAYDANGAWAASGQVVPALLETLRNDAFFSLMPPKSTGRDLFHAGWLQEKLAPFAAAAAADVQATLAALTATTLADAIATHAHDANTVYVCGGGARNEHLLRLLQSALSSRGHTAAVLTSDALGVAPCQVEALAFAWLAYRFDRRQPGNLPSVTGARGNRILGALYPA
jgi:anhydro-N-acetylmuramic acid kinase